MAWIGTQLALMIPDPPDIRERAPLFAPLALVALVNAAAATSIQPALASAFSNAEPVVAETTRFWLWLAAVFSPLLALLKGVLLSAVAWALVVLVGRDVRFRTLLSVNVYGQEILALPGLLAAVVLRWRGPDAIRSPQDLLVPQGLDRFLDLGSSPVLLALAQQATIFHLLWFGFMVWVLPRTTPLTRAASVGVAVALWGAGLLVALIRGVALA